MDTSLVDFYANFFFFFYELKKSNESKDSIFKYDNKKFTLEVSCIFVDRRTDTFWYIINILNTDSDSPIWTRFCTYFW